MVATVIGNLAEEIRKAVQEKLYDATAIIINCTTGITYELVR